MAEFIYISTISVLLKVRLLMKIEYIILPQAIILGPMNIWPLKSLMLEHISQLLISQMSGQLVSLPIKSVRLLYLLQAPLLLLFMMHFSRTINIPSLIKSTQMNSSFLSMSCSPRIPIEDHLSKN